MLMNCWSEYSNRHVFNNLIACQFHSYSLHLSFSFDQIRLKETRDKKVAAHNALKMHSSKTHLSLQLAKEILQKICLSDITKSKSCENLHVL